MEELPAKAAWCAFGTHGPAHAVLFGLVSKLTRWSPAAPLYANALFVITGGCLLLWRARFSRRSLAILAVLIGTFWPAIFWMATAMQESLHTGIALALADCFIGLLKDGTSRTDLALSALIIVFASLMRFTWSLMALPWLLVAIQKHSLRNIISCVFACALFGA